METSLRKQFAIFGDDLNFASRLVEEIAVDDEIIVSKEIKNMVKENEKFLYHDASERLKERPIKSYGDINEIYKIIELRNLKRVLANIFSKTGIFNLIMESLFI